jgi:hypothetical protein
VLPASPRRVPLMIAAAAALVAGSLALSAPAFAADTPAASSSVAAPVLVFPAAGQTVASFSTITFTWTGSAPTFVVEDSSSPATGADGAFATADGARQYVTTASVKFPPAGVNQTRYWHVGAQAADGTIVWSAARQVVFASQAPDAGVGTAVTVTAPPTTTTAPAAPVTTSAPAASAPAAATAPAAAASTAATTPAPASAAAPSSAPATTDSSAAPTASSTAAATLGSERTASTVTGVPDDAAAIPLALSGSLGVALLVLAIVRLVRLRRKAS